MDVSLIVCTRNRASYLSKTLHALRQLRCSIDWELVVVDNGSQDSTPRILQNFFENFPAPVKIVTEPRKGLSRARNAGARAAAAEWLVFTDDDCYPVENFLDQYWHLVSEADPSLGFLGGRVLLYDPDDLPMTIKTVEEPRQFPARSVIHAGAILGANMAIRRAALTAVGEFDELLGAGAPLFAGEDTDMLARLSAEGYEGLYHPAPVVYHHHRRRTPEETKPLRRGYSISRGACNIKGLIDRRTRYAYLRHWYWAARSGRSLWEVWGAVKYLWYLNLRKLGVRSH